MKYLLMALFITASLGCASARYRYYAVARGPERLSTSTHADILPVTVPNGSGNVALTSLGIVEIRSHDKKASVPAIHMRMKVKNKSPREAWTVDVLDQRVTFADGTTRPPAYASSDADHLPLVSVEPGKSRVVDLFYPLPVSEKTARKIDGFDFGWAIRAGQAVAAKETTFVKQRVNERMALALPNMPASHQFEFGTGFGPNWWYMSDYPDHSALDIVPTLAE